MSRLDRPVTLSPGEVLGGYQLLIPVGAGGMGQVWAACRLASPTSDVVAVKTALVNSAAAPEFERVFVDEASIASRIVHPNVCAIHEVGTDRGVAYLVMEWVHGGTLHDILVASPTRRIDCYLAARIAASVCSGLHAVHEMRDTDGNPLHVVHRDVSPQNILISTEGRVTLADFGIARARGQLHTPTRTGELKGKLSYMAPEQLTTKEFDRRADVFGLGCVLYQATTGQRPFHGDDTLETMYRLLETECPRPSTIVPDYPMRLETIVLTALAKDISSRYQTAAELEDDLLRFLAARGRLASESDIAVLVQTSLEERLQQQSQQLESAIEALAGNSTPLSSESATSKTPGKFRPRTTWPWLGALALSLTSAAYVLSNSSRRSSPPPSRAMASGPTEVIATNAIQIDIATDPPGGWLRVDTNPIVPSPWHLDSVPSDAPHIVVAGLAGYRERREVITFERSTRLLMRLEPAAVDRVESATISRPTSRIEEATPRPTPSVTSQLPEWLPPRLRKPKRALDPENPF